MRIAVVGSGISGLATAYLLDDEHEVVVYEASEHVGGHTRTVRLEGHDGPRRVDTGFVVFNETTYPGLLAFLRHLGVGWKDSDMSFSVACRSTGLEYCGTSLATLFAQPTNALRPSFLGMLRDIARFNRRSRELLARNALETPTLGAYIEEGRYGQAFRAHYLVPMASAVWSSSPAQMMEFPTGLLLRFFQNHRFLTVDSHLTWKVVEGGSSAYVERICARLRAPVRTATPVERIERDRFASRGGVTVISRSPGGSPIREYYDAVVLATHADQALRMLDEPTPDERDILGAFPFSDNDVVVHTDTSLLPRAARARASWNYHVVPETPDRAVVTYDMTRLQGLPGPETFLVTLNHTEAIDPDLIRLRFRTGHPIFTVEGARAQSRHHEISGTGATHYAGAWWRNGFHEDGLWSAFRVARALGVEPAERLGDPALATRDDTRTDPVRSLLSPSPGVPT
jgi:predicted NAD/FAD-binding protein